MPELDLLDRIAGVDGVRASTMHVAPTDCPIAPSSSVSPRLISSPMCGTATPMDVLSVAWAEWT